MADATFHLPAVRVVQAQPDHLWRVAQFMREDERDQYRAWTGAAAYDMRACYQDMLAKGEATWALLDRRGAAFYVGGLSNLRPGVFECWAAGTPEGWAAHWRAITRHTRRVLDATLGNGVHRIEIVSLAERTAAGAWYARLGLVAEGRLRRYFADGRDAIIYAKVKEPLP
jgi:RimJ/RimL family protein N-acetyltransferase